MSKLDKQDRFAMAALVGVVGEEHAWRTILSVLRLKYSFTDQQFYYGGNSHDLVDLRAAAINAADKFYCFGPTTIARLSKLDHASCIHHRDRHQTRLVKRWEYNTMWEHVQLINTKHLTNGLDRQVMEKYLQTLVEQREVINDKINEINRMLTENLLITSN